MEVVTMNDHIKHFDSRAEFEEWKSEWSKSDEEYYGGIVAIEEMKVI